MPETFQHQFPNGLTLLAERLPHVRSATFALLVPAGFTREPADRLGLAGLVAELVTRGAGAWDSRQLSLALDNLGADRSESAGAYNVTLSASTLARNLDTVLPIYADIVRRPHLPDDEVEPARDALLQDLQGLEDSPDERVMLELAARHYPDPLSRNRYGTEAGLTATTPDDVRDHHARHFQPDGAILSVAGNIDWEPLKAQIDRLFGDWEPRPSPPLPRAERRRDSGHVPAETQQTQIALACPSAGFDDADFYAARAAISVLSGGMSSRLFTEVREKRGLCYSVRASHSALKGAGSVVAYAGTRADRAQETLDVLVSELKRLGDGVTADELARVKASLKSSLVMSQDSVASRAAAMAGDYFHLGRVRDVDEIRSKIDAVTEAAILEHLERHPPRRLHHGHAWPRPAHSPGLVRHGVPHAYACQRPDAPGRDDPDRAVGRGQLHRAHRQPRRTRRGGGR